MQAEGHTRLDGGRKPLKLKFQIQQELGVKPESTKGAKGSNYAPELSEWLVSTLLSVGTRRSARRYLRKDKRCAGRNFRATWRSLRCPHYG